MNSIFTDGVVWFLVGMVLLLAELVLPGLIVVFFGIGAWVTALCCLLFDIGLNAQLAIFLLSSVISLFSLRRLLKRKYMNTQIGESAELKDEYIGKTAVAIEDFNADKCGKVSFKGITWDAVSTSHIAKGQSLIITGFESIKLFVEPSNNIV